MSRNDNRKRRKLRKLRSVASKEPLVCAPSLPTLAGLAYNVVRFRSGDAAQLRQLAEQHIASLLKVKVARRADSFRKATEDRCELYRVADDVLVVVADGSSGLPFGGPAAARAKQLAAERLHESEASFTTAAAFTALLTELDAALAADPRCGETTLVALRFTEDRIVGASAGDSGALVVRASGEVLDLSEGQHRNHRLGSGHAVPVGFEAPLALGDTLLAATDGLLNYARRELVLEQVATADLDRAAEALCELVRLPSGSFVEDLALALVRRVAAPSE